MFRPSHMRYTVSCVGTLQFRNVVDMSELKNDTHTHPIVSLEGQVEEYVDCSRMLISSEAMVSPVKIETDFSNRTL